MWQNFPQIGMILIRDWGRLSFQGADIHVKVSILPFSLRSGFLRESSAPLFFTGFCYADFL
jgi:hypothetical protein